MNNICKKCKNRAFCVDKRAIDFRVACEDGNYICFQAKTQLNANSRDLRLKDSKNF